MSTDAPRFANPFPRKRGVVSRCPIAMGLASGRGLSWGRGSTRLTGHLGKRVGAFRFSASHEIRAGVESRRVEDRAYRTGGGYPGRARETVEDGHTLTLPNGVLHALRTKGEGGGALA